MRDLARAAVYDKNQISGTNPWVWLIGFDPGDGVQRLLTDNNEQVICDGRTYSPFSFAVTVPSMSGENNDWAIIVEDVTSSLAAWIERRNALKGTLVTLAWVMLGPRDPSGIITAAPPSADYSAALMVFNAKLSGYTASFSLGVPNLTTRKYPPFTVMRDFCHFGLGTAECGLPASVSGGCDRSLARCTALRNQQRFGGKSGVGD